MIIDPIVGPGLPGMVRKIQELVRALQRRLTLNDNVACVVVDIPDTGAANAVITIQHRLGYIPTTYIWNIDRAGSVYDYQRSLWTATQMQLKCSVANAVVRLTVL